MTVKIDGFCADEALIERLTGASPTAALPTVVAKDFGRVVYAVFSDSELPQLAARIPVIAFIAGRAVVPSPSGSLVPVAPGVQIVHGRSTLTFLHLQVVE